MFEEILFGSLFGAFVGFMSSLVAYAVIEANSHRGPDRLRKSMLIGTTTVVVLWAALCFSVAGSGTEYSFGWYLCITPLLSFAVTAEVSLRNAQLHIRNRIAAADELANIGPSIIEWLDADDDGVVSVSDIESSKGKALGQPGVTANLLDALENAMWEYGHNVGSDDDACYVLGRNDIAAAPKKIRQSYMNWAPEFVAKAP